MSRHSWPEYTKRPKSLKLTREQAAPMIQSLTKAVRKSPVLAMLNHSIRFARGRFYLEKPVDFGVSNEVEVIARITPLADPVGVYILETGGIHHWDTIKQGKQAVMSRTLSQQGAEIFYDLGALNKRMREEELSGYKILPEIEKQGNQFQYSDTGEPCTVQEVLYYYFGLPIDTVVQPSDWYAYRRKPSIVESNRDGTAIMVRFSSSSFSGTSFYGTCLYLLNDEEWSAFKIRPNKSHSIEAAVTWLEKREWKGW